MLDSVFALNQTLRSRLINLVAGREREAERTATTASFEILRASGRQPDTATPLNVVVTGNEVSNLHGTGPLVKRICSGWPNVFSIRSRNDWGGVQDFGDWQVCFSPRAASREGFFRNVLSALGGCKVENVLSVPFLPDEFYTSIALHECFGARLCAYLMDDQNIADAQIPDSLMQEFLKRCSLRLATHPELQHIYEQKYGLPFHVLPAIVPADLVPEQRPAAAERMLVDRTALIGSFWDQSWFDRLCDALAAVGRRIDWFGNNKSPWLNLSARRLEKAGITAHGVVPESRLARELIEYPVVIVPAGALDQRESNSGVARLSLPGRILFAVATSQTPVLIVGSPRTCAGRFVKHFGVGDVVPYEATAISEALSRMTQPQAQEKMRRAAAEIAPVLSDRGVSQWLRKSIEMGEPADRRFGDLFFGYDAEIDLDGRRVAAAAQ